jgi:16S rRNA (cytidine1402-2'-O)-methyltransferase
MVNAMTAKPVRARLPRMPSLPASRFGPHERRERRYVLGSQTVDVAALAPGLHIVATPIGNLGDITLRALAALAGADLIACEDTRVTRKLLDRYAIATPLTPYHDHNAAKARPALLRRLAQGAAIALVSDAGTPLVSDPGLKLVQAARDAGHGVTTLPGASALLAALSVAGLPTDQFLFVGFLPPKQAARRTRIAELAGIPASLVLFETGPRIAATLADLAAGLGPRQAALCRELTKIHEEVRRGELTTLAQEYAGSEARGEIVLVVGPPPATERPSVAEMDALLRQALARASLKDAVGEIADATGLPRRELYQRALALAKEAGRDTSDAAPR